MREDGIAEYEKALEICERMLAFEMDRVQESNILRRIGDICLEIFKENADLQRCEGAIQAYKKALVVYTLDTYPHLRARAMRSLGDAFAARSDLVDREESLKQAISSWQEALAVFSRSASALDYAFLQDELCVTYRKLAEVEEGIDNSRRAIEAGENALNIYNLKDHPQEFARAKTNLGSAYLTVAQLANRPPDRYYSCKRAIASYQEALVVYSKDRFPEEFALVKNNLAMAYLAHSEAGGEEDKIECCDRSIQSCRDALLIRTKENNPLAYAATQNNLGNALLALAEEAESLENCQLALQAFGNALVVYKQEQHPMLFAASQNNIGSAYLLRAQILDRSENCLKAIRAAREALRIFSQKSSPEGYAESQGILWLGYLALAEIECRAENCLLALEACQERLAVYSANQNSWDFASCQKDLAITYSILAETEVSAEAKAADCRKGAQAAKEALDFFNEIEYPLEHAESQLLLWAAYSALAEVEDKRENCRQAIEACQIAIRIYGAHSCPAEHADAHKSLGYSFITLAEVMDKRENCQKAIDACNAALEYYTIEQAPIEHAEILRDLAYAYVTISEVEDQEIWGRKALRVYKKASRMFEELARKLGAENDPEAAAMLKNAERCRRSMESCRRILKAGRRKGAENRQQEKVK